MAIDTTQTSDAKPIDITKSLDTSNTAASTIPAAKVSAAVTQLVKTESAEATPSEEAIAEADNTFRCKGTVMKL